MGFGLELGLALGLGLDLVHRPPVRCYGPRKTYEKIRVKEPAYLDKDASGYQKNLRKIRRIREYEDTGIWREIRKVEDFSKRVVD